MFSRFFLCKLQEYEGTLIHGELHKMKVVKGERLSK